MPQVDWTSQLREKPYDLGTPTSQKLAPQLWLGETNVSDLGAERGTQALAKGAASNHERSPPTHLTAKPRHVLPPGGRNSFHVWKSPAIKGSPQSRGCPRTCDPHEGLGTAKAPALSPPQHACPKAWSCLWERRPLHLPPATGMKHQPPAASMKWNPSTPPGTDLDSSQCSLDPFKASQYRLGPLLGQTGYPDLLSVQTGPRPHTNWISLTPPCTDWNLSQYTLLTVPKTPKEPPDP